MKKNDQNATVIGSGPNGLAAAITLQRAGIQTTIYEKESELGGGMRSSELGYPGAIHDLCSAIHPMALMSPFFKTLPLDRYDVHWDYTDIACAQPTNRTDAVALYASLEETAAQFSPLGAKRYRQVFQPLIKDIDHLLADALKPIGIPKHPLLMTKFGMRAALPAQLMAKVLGDADSAALFSGMAAHAVIPFNKLLSSAIGVMLTLAGHTVGWPVCRGGTGSLAKAMLDIFTSLGGTYHTDYCITKNNLPKDAVVFANVAPRNLCSLFPDLPHSYRKKLMRFRHGPAAFKLDYVLKEPIPWTAKACRQAGTVHVGGSFQDVASAEKEAWQGQVPQRPFILVAQQSLADSTRVAGDLQTAWAYCHVPNGCDVDMTETMENLIEDYAPGFRDCIIHRHITTPRDFSQRNPNFVGGDIVGGAHDLMQVIARPVLGFNPYQTPNPNVYLCSASTPPGAGVHGMAGYLAAQSYLKTLK